MTGSSVVICKILGAKVRCKIHVYTYDIDHGYRKQNVWENVLCYSNLCQLVYTQIFYCE